MKHVAFLQLANALSM